MHRWLQSCFIDLQPGRKILAGKAYDTDAMCNFAKQGKCRAITPVMANRHQTTNFRGWAYSQRNFAEMFFNGIKQIRELSTR